MNDASRNDISAPGTSERLTGISASALEWDYGGSCAVMSLAGRAGIGDCAWIGRLLELPAVPGRHDVVVDLSLLSAMDWWVTLMVLWADRVLSRRGWTLVLAGPQPIVARLLADAGATEIVAAAAGVGRGAAAGQKYIAIR